MNAATVDEIYKQLDASLKAK